MNSLELALLAIKDLIQGDPLGALSSWNHSIHFCNWQGVSCGRRHQRVTLLNLSSLALVGSVSPQIGNLTFLGRIDLGNNSFHGKIPQEIGKLFRLQYLQLVNNSFQGEFPINLTHCSDLRVIHMCGNNLGGKIPTDLGSLSNLSYLILAANHLPGAIPHSIGNLSNLHMLSLPYNNLEGSIPTQLGQLSKLEYPQLSANNLSGFYVSSNQFYGQIPSSIANATRLSNTIGFGYESFKGLLPHSIANLSTKITWLTLQDNYIFGSIPLGIGNLVNLQYLVLDDNMFTGSIPNSIGKLSMLEILMLYKNNISGEIPSSIRNLSRLGTLDLSTNTIEGSIPISLEGGHGYVYKGILNSDEQIVAVKVLNLHEHGANKFFVTECQALKNIHHRNHVKTITTCSSIDFKGHDFKALVFELMENGNLENWLHPKYGIGEEVSTQGDM
ncbi:unnamed protein product [Camellia sinensis]